ncbi:MbcA/ParS/Xre antitoxin family protein [Daejeonella sp.]|uniref:MbcA/ParS/Xre antitoxin family protein n=1 Tax=Daejeonella sp. TaxID=2805397 RepID=UPI002722380A|nr:MbcA/ParS/Xre antitoxin family protein [Daejeonella sp.]MDO8992942.1 MbcA/ParS/Xre antitoxin family protein [Daejeonella sp.]MDP2415669.1 MbcA/ParS/Xre antitoxin family protein [Daejeonella sp.]
MKEKNIKNTAAKPYTATDSHDSAVSETMLHYQSMYANDIALLTHSKNGLSAKAALDFIAVSGFSYQEFQEIFKTTVKTIQNYSIQNMKLDAALSEKLLKSFALFNKGFALFGSPKAFHNWLNTSAYGLGNEIPYNFLDTITGISLIEEELIRIEYGDLA